VFLRERLAAAGVGVWDIDAVHEPGHGAFLVVPMADPGAASAAAARLRERGVIVDARSVPRGAAAATGAPEAATPLPAGAAASPAACLRLCPDVLTTREEMEQAARVVAEVLC
jgi:hypothetical protein